MKDVRTVYPEDIYVLTLSRLLGSFCRVFFVFRFS